jgi:hypothetical protein
MQFRGRGGLDAVSKRRKSLFDQFRLSPEASLFKTDELAPARRGRPAGAFICESWL